MTSRAPRPLPWALCAGPHAAPPLCAASQRQLATRASEDRRRRSGDGMAIISLPLYGLAGPANGRDQTAGLSHCPSTGSFSMNAVTKIGRASLKERGCQDRLIPGVDGYIKKKKRNIK